MVTDIANLQSLTSNIGKYVPSLNGTRVSVPSKTVQAIGQLTLGAGIWITHLSGEWADSFENEVYYGIQPVSDTLRLVRGYGHGGGGACITVPIKLTATKVVKAIVYQNTSTAQDFIRAYYFAIRIV